MSTKDGRDTTPIRTWHPRFNAVDGDITVESSDLALFKLHRNNLQAYAGAIPLPESASSPSGSSAVDIIQVLPEPASVLETVFEFLYPKRYYPELEDVEFVKLMAVAETVEKYQVFAALPLCVVRLKPFVQNYPLEIFHYAIKYENTTLVNEAAPYVVFNHPILKIAEDLPLRVVLPWLRYREAVWKAIFDDAKAFLQITAELPNKYYHLFIRNTQCNLKATDELFIKPSCHVALKVWIGYLEGFSTFPDLVKQISKNDDRTPLKQMTASACSGGCLRFCDGCPLPAFIAGTCSEGLQKAQSIKFATFLGNDMKE